MSTFHTHLLEQRNPGRIWAVEREKAEGVYTEWWPATAFECVYGPPR